MTSPGSNSAQAAGGLQRACFPRGAWIDLKPFGKAGGSVFISMETRRSLPRPIQVRIP